MGKHDELLKDVQISDDPKEGGKQGQGKKKERSTTSSRSVEKHYPRGSRVCKECY